jgi:thioredoxin-related protein
MKKFLLTFLILVGSIVLIACQTGGGEDDKFKQDPEQVIQEAMKNKEFLILVVESADCRYCTKLNKEVLNDPDVKMHMKQNRVKVAIINAYGNRKITDPATKEQIEEESFAIAYRVQGFPTIIVFDPKDNYKMLYYINGYIGKEDFIGLLKYLGSGCYEKIEYKEFVKRGMKC